MERLLTTEEVSDLLRIDPVTVRRLVTRGDLTGFRITGEYRFAPTDVEKFVESQRVMVNQGPGPNHPQAKFTERARKVMALATEEAYRYHHDAVGTEHILLAIMGELESVGAKVLNQLQLSESHIRTQVEALHPTGNQPSDDMQIGMTQPGKVSIELAVQEAHSFDHHYIGTEHLLLGLLREESGLANQILLQSDVTPEKARALVTKLLAEDKKNANP